MKPLENKQRKFVQEYIKDCNATQAAIRAGYSKRTAQEQSSRLLSKAIIKAEIEKLLNENKVESLVTVEFILNGFMEIAQRCMQKVPVLDSEGNETGEWKFEASGANRALEMLGKYKKMFVESHEHSGAGGGPIQYVGLSSVPVQTGGEHD